MSAWGFINRFIPIDAIWDVNRLAFDIAEDFATGEIDRDTLDKGLDLFAAAIDMQASVVELMKLQAIVGTVLVYMELKAALIAGKIAIPFVKEAVAFYKTTQVELEPVISKLRAAQRRVRGIVDTVEIQQALAVARIAHTVGTVVSEDYREKVIEMQDMTRRVSLQVFGEVSTLNSALGLLQMANYDLARLRGEEPSDAEMRFFQSQIDILSRIESKSSIYARSPATFWFDFNKRYLAPTEGSAFLVANQTARELGAMGELLKRTSDMTIDGASKFRAYTRKLDPFISEETARELDQIRRNFKTDVLIPLQTISDTVSTEFPVVKIEINKLSENQKDQQEEIDILAEFQTDPDQLEPDASERVKRRWRSQLTATLGFEGTPGELIRSQQERIIELYEEGT